MYVTHRWQMFLKNRLSALLLCTVACSNATSDEIGPRLIRTLTGGSGCVFSPGGARLAGNAPGASWRATDVKLWDVATGNLQMTLKGHAGGIWRVSFSPDGKRIATNENYIVKVWDIDSQKEILSFSSPAFTRFVLFSPDGGLLATSGDDGSVRLWDSTTGRRRLLLRGHRDRVHGLAFSPDGNLLASASADLNIHLWDVSSGKLRRSLEGHHWYVRNVAFGPEGKRLISGSDDRTARVWDVQTGAEVFKLSGHTDWVRSVAYDPDGKWLVTGSSDHTAKIWDAQTGQEAFVLSGHTEPVGSLSFSPDGKILATGGMDSTIKLWDFGSLQKSDDVR